MSDNTATAVETTATKGKRGKPEGWVSPKFAPSTMRPFIVKMFGDLPDPAIEALSKSPEVRKTWQASPEFEAWDADKDAKMQAARVESWKAKVGKMGADERKALIAALADTTNVHEAANTINAFYEWSKRSKR